MGGQAVASDLASVTTVVTQEVFSGGVEIETPTIQVLAKQAIILVNGVATLPAIDTMQTLKLYDLRGTLSPLTVSVTVDPMSDGINVRNVTLEAVSFSGDDVAQVQGKTVTTAGAPATETEFITAPPAVNRFIEASMRLTVHELTGKAAVSGLFGGKMVFTVN